MPHGPVRLIAPVRHGDARGWFQEVWSAASFAADGIADSFVQDNHSYSAAPFTLRGLHCQTPPHAQTKLVRCARGRIFDVAVDARSGSPTHGQWVGAELSAKNGCQLYVPVGFLHAFITLEPDCEVMYKVSSGYAPANDAGVAWDDPAIGIDWPLPPGATPELSAKDRVQPALASLDGVFGYDGRPLTAID